MTTPEAEPLPLARLLDNYRLFLSYMEGRVGDRATAEDILQDAFAKVIERPGLAPDDEGIVPWFYRLSATLKPEYAEAIQARPSVMKTSPSR